MRLRWIGLVIVCQLGYIIGVLTRIAQSEVAVRRALEVLTEVIRRG